MEVSVKRELTVVQISAESNCKTPEVARRMLVLGTDWCIIIQGYVVTYVKLNHKKKYLSFNQMNTSYPGTIYYGHFQ